MDEKTLREIEGDLLANTENASDLGNMWVVPCASIRDVVEKYINSLNKQDEK